MADERVLIKKSDLVAICDEIRKNDLGAYNPMPFSEIVSGIDTACRGQYQEGKQAEYERLVDPKKIIPKTVTGKGIVFVNDVSEIPHSISLKLSSDTITDFSKVRIKQYGEQLIPYPYYDKAKTQGGIDYIVNGDGTITADGATTTTTNFVIATSLPLVDGVTYYFRDVLGSVPVIISYYDETGTTKYVSTSLTWKSAYMLRQFYIQIANTTVDNIRIYPVLYEQSSEKTHTPVPDGSLTIESTSPILVLLSDTADVDISITYNKSWGMSTEQERFWKAYQKDETNAQYSYAFAGMGWTDETFKPIHDIRPISAYSMFYTSGIVDLYGILKRQGVSLDFSRCTGVSSLFYGTKIKEFGVLDFTSTSSLGSVFYRAAVEKIEKIIVTEKTTYDRCFLEAFNLTDVTFEGVIGNDISFADCTKLSKASIRDLVWGTFDSSITLTFSLAAVNKAFETSAGANDGSQSEEWQMLMDDTVDNSVTLV